MKVDRQALAMLREQVIRRTERKQEVEQLEAELEEQEKGLFALKIDMHNQQVDVDLLNRFSLKNVFYNMTGKKEALLEKETSEARTAKEKYDRELFQIEQKKRKISEYRKEITSLNGCEDAYWRLLQDCRIHADGEDMEYVRAFLQQRVDELLSELDAAEAYGQMLVAEADKVLENISNVQDWNYALSGTARDMSMQGYLGGCQKRIDDLKKSIGILLWKLKGLPLSSPENVDEILIFPENYLLELAGKLGADERLREADSAVRAAKKQLQELLDNISRARTVIRNEAPI